LQVLDAARSEFARLGYRAVTMRAVAEKAKVSTRTLYNNYADKLSLFTACLDQSGINFPRPDPQPGESPWHVLRRYAAALLESLSSDTSLRLSMMVYREGSEFPELLSATEANQIQYLIHPLAQYFQTLYVLSHDSEAKAKIFIAMTLSEWQRRVTFRHPGQRADEIAKHAATVADIFVRGGLVSFETESGKAQLSGAIG